MKEFDLLQHIYAANTSLDSRVLIGPGDDMAMVQLNGRKLLAAVDQIVDGRHFVLKSTPLNLIGRKAVTRSLSDIAAMAGTPVATLVAATLPPNFGSDRARELFDAMRATAQRYECPLIGGDIAFHPTDDDPMVCAVTVLAEPSNGRPILRSGAQPGDLVYVSGRLGGSLQSDGLGRHLTFEPRLDLARAIAQQLGDRLHAMIDLSDGLGRDVSHIAELSNVQIRLKAEDIPCNAGCDWHRALGDGEDYELCFTTAAPVPTELLGVPLSHVGEVAARDRNEAIVVVMNDGRTINADDLGWQHESSTQNG